jgi:hypothetical protein
VNSSDHLLDVIVLVWILIGSAGVIGFVVLVLGENGRDAKEWFASPIFLGLGLGSGSLLALGLSGGGWPSAGLYVLRATGVLATVLAIWLVFRIQRTTLSGPPGTEVRSRIPAGRWSALAGAIVLAILTWITFQLESLPNSTIIVSNRVGENAPLPLAINSLPATWTATLCVLAIGVMIFLFLFVQKVGRGGAAKLESHWEGIGGGVSGWRMSSSLGYLIVAGILALLFTVFLLRFDAGERERDSVGRPTPTVIPSPTAH